MDGVIERGSEESKILEIRVLSEDLKKKIEEEIQVICCGEEAINSNWYYHSFRKVIKELNLRLNKEHNNKKGLIGELLLNIIIREFTDMKVVSPFFNMEERSVKKGFDIIAIDGAQKLWIIESKSGELGEGLITATEKIRERLQEAKRDLKDRLDGENAQLWLNARGSINGYLADPNEKNAVISILSKMSETHIREDKNVLLGGVVFCSFDTNINEEKLSGLYDSILGEEIFADLKMIAIHKQTYETIINFFKSLEEDESL